MFMFRAVNQPYYDEYGSTRFGCYYYGPANDAKVSGTYNHLSMQLYAIPDATGSTPIVSSILVQTVVVTIGTWVVVNDTGLSFDPVDYMPLVRYSSTYFPDGNPIPISVDIDFLLFTSTGPIQQSFHRTFTPKSYQKLQTLGTNQEYTSPGNHVYSSWFESMSNELTQAADSNLHPPNTTLPGPIAQNETKATIYDKIRDHTLFVALTHGSSNTLDDSDSSEFVKLVGQNPSQDSIYKRAGLKSAAGIPGYNFVAAYACSVGGTALPEAFRIPAIGSCTTGFPFITYDRVFTELEWAHYSGGDISYQPSLKLADHAESMFFSLAQFGTTIAQALSNTNTTHVTVTKNASGDLVANPMVAYGDSLTRLTYVYLTAAQWATGMDPNIEWVRLDTPI